MPAEVAEPVAYSKSTEIPNKLYFRIGEVSRLAGIKPYVLRFWESEFPGLGPKKSGTGHRLYRRKDVEIVLQIKHLLYEKRYTIEGARKLLEGKTGPDPEPPVAMSDPLIQAGVGDSPALAKIKNELHEILKILS